MDTYNKIDFFNGVTLVDTVRGCDAAGAVLALAAGNQTDDNNNRYIIISAMAGGLFDKILLTSTQNSCELDNLEWGLPQRSDPLLFREPCRCLFPDWAG